MRKFIWFFLPFYLLAAPKAPSDLQLTPAVHEVTIAWSDNSSDETGFKIFRDGSLIHVTSEGVTRYVDRGLQSQKTYRYEIKATTAEKAVWNFNPVANNQASRSIVSTNGVEIGGTVYPLSYQTILRSGDTLGGETYGLVKDKYGKAILNKDGSKKISPITDFTSLLPVGKKLFMVSNFETTPSAMYLSELVQDTKTGKLSAISTKNIDMSAFNGVMETCAGSVTPWNSHLAGEEVLTSARWVGADGSVDYYYDNIARYDNDDISRFNPYFYGYMVEVKVLDEQAHVDVSKHYAMGRFAHEIAVIMPDKKTAYMSDDNQNGLLYKFVADKAGDLSAGTLYAAKWHQVSASNGGTADLTWISLGHATDAEIAAALADKTIRFSQMFDDDGDRDANNVCTPGYKPSNWSGENACLKLMAGMGTIASRLESGRYASMLGATSEFYSMEGMAYNPKANQLYVSISSVKKGMENNKYKGEPDTTYDKGGNNDIRVASNRCGIVYTLVLDSHYNAVRMQPLLAGVEEGSSSCKQDGIISPDNISFSPEANTLFIGEDSWRDNNILWAYNIGTNDLKPIQTAPYGAEITSVKYYHDIKGFGYLMSVIQHPYEKSWQKDEHKPTAQELKAYTGYIGPFKVK